MVKRANTGISLQKPITPNFLFTTLFLVKSLRFTPMNPNSHCAMS